jgi:hypothetical protein
VYEAVDASGGHALGLAESRDSGRTWSKLSPDAPVFTARTGDSSAWDNGVVGTWQLKIIIIIIIKIIIIIIIIIIIKNNNKEYHHLQDHPMGRNPNTLVHILGALHPRSGVPIRHVLRKLQTSPDFKSRGSS